MTLDLTKPLQLEDGTPVKHVYTSEQAGSMSCYLVVFARKDVYFEEWMTDGGRLVGTSRKVINVPERTVLYGVLFSGGGAEFSSWYSLGDNIKATFEGDNLVAVELIK